MAGLFTIAFFLLRWLLRDKSDFCDSATAGAGISIMGYWQYHWYHMMLMPVMSHDQDNMPIMWHVCVAVFLVTLLIALSYMRYICHRLEIGDMEKMMWFVCSGSSSKCLVGMPADTQANYGISPAHVQCFSCWKVEQMFVMSFSDVTMIAHAIGEGSI